ncbi:uncharacterized protein N7477_000399 [Penicillium maclennaniae]|uniref:uncharacterized protein n=1 Tax=Penicillium maclennaniae TaxID=1343394 RepID=UPI0025417411|nr:uncharacterized protein N7477_000399 [Penicillium maclennaniae]KAJ5684054.1 hypothetical protein N7477_000399 [Penicillium maclennaniae]
MEYFNQIKNRRRSSQIMTPSNPVLNAEEEAYLRQLTAEPDNAPEPPGQKELLTEATEPTVEASQASLLNETSQEAQSVPLPTSSLEELGRELGEEERKAHEKSENIEKTQLENAKPDSAAAPEKKKKRWSAMFWKKNTDPEKTSSTGNDSQPQNPAPIPTATTTTDNDDQAKKDQEDMTDILERLNLAADNNRVFSVSEETQELLRKFKLIFKDLINGVPTAYHDLEMLLTNGNRQLQDTYTKLPGFLQKLIEKLPEKWTETLAPEMLAVAGERAAQSGINMENVGKAAAAANKVGLNIPSLKELVSKPAAIVGMLRSIMAFLRARFPAVLGMNVLWSLALFILLFVLWYCHKRGREVRLENERLVTEDEINKLNEDTEEGKIRTTETLTTTAPKGASADEVREGVKKVEAARASAVQTPLAASEPLSPSDENARPGPAPLPTRSKSRLSIFGRLKPEPTPSTIAPYPGT